MKNPAAKNLAQGENRPKVIPDKREKLKEKASRKEDDANH